MEHNIDFSVIVPHKNSVHYLPKLFSSIPISDKIEIIIVDNSQIPITKEGIGINREYTLLYSETSRGAGGARNVGIENANGKWLIFADADDYFTEEAFDIFSQYINSDSDIIYFAASGIYIDTGEYSDRGEQYTKLVKDYLSGEISENYIRTHFSPPWSKMVKADLVNENNIRYDEVVAANDVYFSTLTGYYAKKISAIDIITYVVTVSKGSLTKRRDYDAIYSRFKVSLRKNYFLRKHGLGKYQNSIMYYIYELEKNNLKNIFIIISLLIKYKQNPFIGYGRWIKTFFLYKKQTKRDCNYNVK